MAFEEGTATDYNNLLLKLKDFVTRANSISAVTDPGISNTGDGDVTDVFAADVASTETWTLVCTTGGGDDVGKFSVTGSVSGAKAEATVGTPYDNNIVAFTINDGDLDFIEGDDFQFTVTKVMGTEKWTVKKYTTDSGTVDGDNIISDELILEAPGLSGDDEIFVGIQTYYREVDEYFNWTLNGYTGYVSDPLTDFFDHPGTIWTDRTGCPQVLLDDDSMKYWFIANGRRIAGVMRIGTGVYEPFYLGLILPYGLPTIIPYPLVIGGAAVYNTIDIGGLRFSSTHNTHRGYMDPYANNTNFDDRSSLRFWNGTVWFNFRNYAGAILQTDNNVWPGIYASSTNKAKKANFLMQKCEKNIDGSYPMFPLILITTKEDPNKNIFGELQGIFAVFGEGVKGEDVISYGGKTYKVFKNCYLENPENFYALCLE